MHAAGWRVKVKQGWKVLGASRAGVVRVGCEWRSCGAGVKVRSMCLEPWPGWDLRLPLPAASQFMPHPNCFLMPCQVIEMEKYFVFEHQPGEGLEWRVLVEACSELDKLAALVDSKIKVRGRRKPNDRVCRLERAGSAGGWLRVRVARTGAEGAS